MSLSDIPQFLLELLWPFVFVFSFIVLVKASIRGFRSKRNMDFKHPGWLFVVAAVLSLGIYLLLGSFFMNPWTDSLFLSEKLNKEEAQLFFMGFMTVFLIVIPLLVTPLVCRYWPASTTKVQRDKV
jgi:hypothetical protein